jgi:uncharacterized damage-inducible protein DinB
MSPKERSSIVQLLESGRADFLDATSSLSDAQAATQPAPERWSVLQCVEHVVTVEYRFLGWLEKAQRLDQAQPDPERENSLSERVMDRSTRRQAPEAVQPTGRFAQMAVALEEFNAARTRTVQLAETQGEELYLLTTTHPFFGPLNGVELLHIIAGHARRHAAQIRETRQAL